jgi:hypothetical protein
VASKGSLAWRRRAVRPSDPGGSASSLFTENETSTGCLFGQPPVTDGINNYFAWQKKLLVTFLLAVSNLLQKL